MSLTIVPYSLGIDNESLQGHIPSTKRSLLSPAMLVRTVYCFQGVASYAEVIWRGENPPSLINLNSTC